MASSAHTVGPNFREKIIKAVGLRLSDALGRDTTDYAEIICGDGAPSGGYGRHSGASLVYIRKDASGVDVVVYVSPDGGTTWNAVESSGLGSDAELSAIAGLTSAANKIIRFTGSGTAELIDCTNAGAALLDDPNATAQRTTLGLVIGTDVQAYDAELAAIAGLTSAADKIPYFTGAGTAALADCTYFGRLLMAAANGIVARWEIGLGAYLCRAVISLGAEAGDAIAVTLQMKDVDGNNIARQQVVHVEWFCSDADVTFTAVTTGTLLGALGTKVLVMTDATGLAVLTLTDTTPNFAGSGGLLATPASNGVDADVGFASFKVATFA